MYVIDRDICIVPRLPRLRAQSKKNTIRTKKETVVLMGSVQELVSRFSIR